MAREELKWQNIDTDDLPADLKKSFDEGPRIARQSSQAAYGDAHESEGSAWRHNGAAEVPTHSRQ
jgi:hypothetical protein